MAEIFRIEFPDDLRHAVFKAAELLRRGELVAVPTETVYGLAANAWDEEAVLRIFAAKERPASNPLIVHVASREMALQCVSNWPEDAELLARQFWPGPLTIVLPKSSRIPDAVTAGGNTVGIRWPSHPFMQALIQECGFPLAAPSANSSNELSPTQAEHVIKSLGERIPLVIDAGPSAVGIESTVIEVTASGFHLLRPGSITSKAIEKTLGKEQRDSKKISNGPAKSPGQLARHYSPQACLVLRTWKNETELTRIIDESGVNPRLIHLVCHEKVPHSNSLGRIALIPADAEAYARALYSELHRCDETGAKLIIVEDLPATPEWEGVRDRLTRAAHQR
ncbi:MAG: L-threonylcarbamoyladenylate synthase [Verrucomicrobiota bacterium]|nr:L-threonylcarbamoyladenylate synthase [Verrucomicrobiota bacterium]